MLLGIGARDECFADVTEQLPHMSGSILTYCFFRKRFDFQVGKGCFTINDTKLLGLHVLFALSKSVLTGIKILLFWPFSFLPLMGRF